MDKIPDKLPAKLLEEGLEIIAAQARDMPEKYVSQVIEKSRQPHVLKFEGHEDAGGRFKDLPAYYKWAEKDRLVYLLMKGEDVGGIIWFGRRANQHIDPSYGLTFGIRLYEGCVGKGLSVPFMRAAHDDLGRFYPGEAIWLDFAEDNIAARKAYEKFGYKHLTEADGRVIMGYHIGK